VFGTVVEPIGVGIIPSGSGEAVEVVPLPAVIKAISIGVGAGPEEEVEGVPLAAQEGSVGFDAAGNALVLDLDQDLCFRICSQAEADAMVPELGEDGRRGWEGGWKEGQVEVRIADES
jgi:hypothetical protein